MAILLANKNLFCYAYLYFCTLYFQNANGKIKPELEKLIMNLSFAVKTKDIKPRQLLFGISRLELAGLVILITHINLISLNFTVI